MKMDLFLFIFALCLAFLSGNMTYSLKSKQKGSLKDLEELRKLHIELQEEVTPYIRLDLNLDYPTPERLKLLQAREAIRPRDKVLTLNSSECLKSKISQLSSEYINKETLWMGFLCSQISNLPPDFFQSPPFVHSNGMSYSYMQFQMLSSHFQKIDWLENNAKYMNIAELKSLDWPTSTNQRFLIQQSNSTIDKIIDGENTFLTKKYYFIKTGNLKYYIIDRTISERFFNRARFNLSTQKTNCLFKLSNVCWDRRPHNLQSLLSQSTIIFFVGTIIILFMTAQSLYSRYRKKKSEEDRKKHALRILTHELRTPIASLIVQMSELNKKIPNYSQDMQESFLKIESQVYRLKHLAEKSRSYLQTDNTGLINLNKVEIHSLKEFIEDILFEYDDREIKCKFIKDTALYIDPYWLKMCIMNLIDNAIRYGVDPISITVNIDGQVQIKIQDQGQIAYQNIKELLRAKHKNSKGLGLGLIIVNKTLKEMGAKLLLSTNPTTFTILLPLDIKENQDEKNIIS